MLFLRDHCLIGCPEIREAVTSTIAVWDGLPQPLTRLFAPIPNRISDHLRRLAAQGNPKPGVVRFFEDKRPELIQFQRRGSGIFWIGRDQGRAQGGMYGLPSSWLSPTHILIGVSRELVEDKKSATLVEATGEPLSDFMACACRSR